MPIWNVFAWNRISKMNCLTRLKSDALIRRLHQTPSSDAFIRRFHQTPFIRRLQSDAFIRVKTLRIWLLVPLLVLTGCSWPVARSGEESCASSRWWIEGPARVAARRYITFRVMRCGVQEGHAPLNLIWSVSSPDVLRIVSSNDNGVRVFTMAQGHAELTAIGPGGPSTIAITVE